MRGIAMASRFPLIRSNMKNKKKTYEELLENAPPHYSDDFIGYLRENNRVVFEDEDWLVIENAKYHSKERTWFTAFTKGRDENLRSLDLRPLLIRFGGLEWKKKATVDQSVHRFHIHLFVPKIVHPR